MSIIIRRGVLIAELIAGVCSMLEFILVLIVDHSAHIVDSIVIGLY